MFCMDGSGHGLVLDTLPEHKKITGKKMKTFVSFVLITMVNFAMVGILLKNFIHMCYNVVKRNNVR
jgi:hypothetical protein